MIHKWNETTERWLPLVKEMERLGFGDYAVPEIYRSADETINLLEALDSLLDGLDSNTDERHGLLNQEWETRIANARHVSKKARTP